MARLGELAPRPDGAPEAEALEIPAWWFDRHAGPRIEADGEVVALEPVRGYAKRGTAGWVPAGEGRREYEEGRTVRAGYG